LIFKILLNFRSLLKEKKQKSAKKRTMRTTTHAAQVSGFSRQVIGKLKAGISANERFENLSAEILKNISIQLLLVDDHNKRKTALLNYYLELEKAQKLEVDDAERELPGSDKKIQAALTHLKCQFKLRYAKYIYSE
jgi:hypothetical protein